MSKFADKLQNTRNNITTSIGFRKSATAEQETRSALLIADLTKAGEKKTKSIIKSGIDAAVISMSGLDVTSFKELTAAIGDIPLGLLTDHNTPDNITEFIEYGCDFIIFDLKTPLKAINKDGVGKILKIDSTLTPGMTKAINELSLSIDGVLIAVESSALTIEHLLIFRLFTDLLDKPVLTTVEPSLTNDELSSLHKSGIKGLMLTQGTSAKTFTDLKKQIEALPKIKATKPGHNAVLPRITDNQKSMAEVEEEEEEDEDY